MRTSRCWPRGCGPTTCCQSPTLRRPSARPVLAGDVGRGDVRHLDALSQGDPLGAAGRAARAHPQHPVPDAAARHQRGRATPIIPTTWSRRSSRNRPRPASICFASSIRSTGCPTCRLAMEAVRDTGMLCEAGDLLHRRHPRPRPAQVRPEVLRRTGQGAGKDGGQHPGHQGHGGAVQALRGPAARRGLRARNRHPDPLPHARFRRRADGVASCWRRRRAWTSSMPPWPRCRG